MRVFGRGVLIALVIPTGLVAAIAALLGAAALALATLGGAALVTGAIVAVAALVSELTPFRPRGDPSYAPEPVPGQASWDLPTGSRLAYVRLPAVGTPRLEPIVYLHGGPGVSELPERTAAFGRLAADGYDIYLYDQIGVRRSARLADPSGHTLARNVADLEAVRRRSGAGRVILIGHSWGATLAAAYLAAHPGRGARVVFSSPGALALREYGTAGTGVVDRLPPAGRDRVNALLYQPRATTAWALAQVNPRAARAFAGDRELDARFDRVTSAATPGLFCDTSIAPLPVTGTGFYANQVTLADRDAPDPRPALRSASIPALVPKGACDYLPWRFAVEYRDVLPGAMLIYLPGAGHQAYLDRPEPYLAAVRAFLLELPPPRAPYAGDAPPPEYRGRR